MADILVWEKVGHQKRCNCQSFQGMDLKFGSEQLQIVGYLPCKFQLSILSSFGAAAVPNFEKVQQATIGVYRLVADPPPPH